ncbi:MAG TPA: trypsin-like peptidase domain-containing protein [Verrucomicrobiota bacterium]|nr:trypsin-like peptidase domain-containing protein [Verrucomicrobiota bacterium]
MTNESFGRLLVKGWMLRYGHTMLKSRICALVLAGGCIAAMADTIQLKDNATITGKILAEKRDSVAVDVGYTVLVVPRSSIANLTKDDETSARTTKAPPSFGRPAPKESQASVAPPVADTRGGMYHVAKRPPATKDVRDLVRELGEAVVQVRTPGGLGSGFILNEEGFLITNFHVIEGETQIYVEVYHLKDGQLERTTYKNVRIVALNKFADLALLQIEDKDAPRFKYVLIGNSDDVPVGDRVFAIGSPLGLERTVTEGILSTKTRQLSGALYLQTTAQINPGNSGGPLFNMGGEVVGVTSMKITSGEGLGFAIPSVTVRHFLDNRDAYSYSANNPNTPHRYLEPPSRTRAAQNVEE